MKRQFIREILDVITTDTISFAGGLPDPALFPLDAFQSAAERALKDPSSLQYSRSQGFAPLREKIARRYSERGFATRPEEILITTGSQQAINLIALSMLQEGVTIELPAYLGALSVFRLAKTPVDGVPIESDGIALEPFERSVAATKAAYLVTDFQNPTGVRYSDEKREAVAALLKAHDALLVEDAAYGELYFDRPMTPISASMPERSFHLGSFSKILVPGLRVGWVRASEANLRRILVVKEALDLHTSTLGQRLIDGYWEAEGLDAHIETIRRHYGAKKRALANILREELPEFSFVEPDGGMFIYGRLQGANTKTLVDACLKRDVVFVPGGEFYPEALSTDEIRFNFTHADPETMRRGVRIIARCHRERVAESEPLRV